MLEFVLLIILNYSIDNNTPMIEKQISFSSFPFLLVPLQSLTISETQTNNQFTSQPSTHNNNNNNNANNINNNHNVINNNSSTGTQTSSPQSQQKTYYYNEYFPQE